MEDRFARFRATPVDSSQAGEAMISYLERLSALRERGALTEEEFQAAKRKLLS